MKKATCKKVEFQLAATPGREVSVAGTFNNWDPGKTQMKDPADSGHYKTVIAIPPGIHEYRFVVDGQWQNDPVCLASALNAFGSRNSVIEVK